MAVETLSISLDLEDGDGLVVEADELTCYVHPARGETSFSLSLSPAEAVEVAEMILRRYKP